MLRHRIIAAAANRPATTNTGQRLRTASHNLRSALCRLVRKRASSWRKFNPPRNVDFWDAPSNTAYQAQGAEAWAEQWHIGSADEQQRRSSAAGGAAADPAATRPAGWRGDL